MHKYLKISLATLLFCGAAFSGASAAQTMVPKLDHEGRKGDVARLAKQKAQDRFTALDKDSDGRLSRSEVEPDSHYLAEKFPERDIDRDGFLNWEEYVGHNRWNK